MSYAYDHHNSDTWIGKANSEGVLAVFNILERYWEKLQDGTIGDIMPDPFYKWRYKDEVDVGQLIKDVEDEFIKEMSSPFWAGCKPPELTRLLDNGGMAAIALVQELDAVLGPPPDYGSNSTTLEYPTLYDLE